MPPAAHWESSDWPLALPVTIGVISDTHMTARQVSLPDPIRQAFGGLPLILHAGDVGDFAVIEALGKLAPVEAVWGNTDPAPLQMMLPQHRLIRIGTFLIGLTHGHGAPGDTLGRALGAFEGTNPRPDAIVFGHSHRPLCETQDGVLLFNPGAINRAFEARPSFGLLHLGEGVEGEIVYL
jgi:putative phosphoesterase